MLDYNNSDELEPAHSIFIKVVKLFFRIIPEIYKVHDRYKFNLLKVKYTNEYRYYRLFMGFPSKGQRTWSNGKSAKKRRNFAKEFEFVITEEQFRFKCPRSVIMKLTHLEYLNSM